jgi:hypothetical protein
MVTTAAPTATPSGGQALRFQPIMNSTAQIVGNALTVAGTSTLLSSRVYNISVQPISLSFITTFNFKNSATTCSFGIAEPATLTPFVRCTVSRNFVLVGKNSEFSQLSSVGADDRPHRITIRADTLEGQASCVFGIDGVNLPPVALTGANWLIAVQTDLGTETNGFVLNISVQE